MRIDLFRMERTQCLYENEVEYNLSESGVLPLRVEDLLEGSPEPGWLLKARLGYPPSRGSETLRDRIALFYGGEATRAHVMVTNGGSEANYVAFWGLLEPGDRAAIMIPNYLQGWGLARAYASRADPFRLVERRDDRGRRWALDVEGLERAVTRRTKVILVTNPNNPTGAILTEDEMDAVARAARRSGAWIVGPPKTVERLCSYHDYLTLTPTYLSNRFAEIVMEPSRREAILERTRGILRANLPRLERWLGAHGDVLDCIPPLAGAILLLRYDLPIGSVALFDRLRREQSVLITPGAHFGIGRYIRVGYGDDAFRLERGLARIDTTLAELRRRTTASRRRAPRRRPRQAAAE